MPLRYSGALAFQPSARIVISVSSSSDLRSRRADRDPPRSPALPIIEEVVRQVEASGDHPGDRSGGVLAE